MKKTKEESWENKESGQEELNHSIAVLKKKISYLEEELARKEETIEKLKQENLVLFKTALKNSENKIDSKKPEK